MIVIIFLILTVFFWGSAPLFDKIGLKRLDPLTALTFRSIVVTVILLVATFFSRKAQTLFNIDLKSATALGLSALFAGLLGMLTYYSALRLGATSKIVPLAATYPLVTAILGMAFLGEHVTIYRMFGIVLIVTGIWLVLMK